LDCDLHNLIHAAFNEIIYNHNFKQQFLTVQQLLGQNISCETLKGVVKASNLIQNLWDYLRWVRKGVSFGLLFCFAERSSVHLQRWLLANLVVSLDLFF